MIPSTAPAHSACLIGLLQPTQVCGQEGLCPFPLASLSHSFHMANAAAASTELCWALTPSLWLGPGFRRVSAILDGSREPHAPPTKLG